MTPVRSPQNFMCYTVCINHNIIVFAVEVSYEGVNGFIRTHSDVLTRLHSIWSRNRNDQWFLKLISNFRRIFVLLNILINMHDTYTYHSRGLAIYKKRLIFFTHFESPVIYLFFTILISWYLSVNLIFSAWCLYFLFNYYII